MINITFLGTSCMVPTKDRNHSAILISFRGEGILLDCGEGTQRQLKKAGIRPTQITKICISHWHGDHVLGIPGLIQTLGAAEYSGVLEIYGPVGTRQFMENMFKAFVFDRKVEIKVHDVKQGVFFENREFMLEAFPLEHGIKTIGFRFTEKDRRRINVSLVRKIGIPDGPLLGKLQDGQDVTFKGKTVLVKDATYIVHGKRIGYVADTVLCDGCYKIAEDADLLVCEASYASDLEDKAEEYKHLTAKQGGLIASKANVKKLYLTHFSARYKNVLTLQEDAQAVFDNVFCAEDLMKVKL